MLRWSVHPVLASLAVLDLALAFGTIHIAATRPARAREALDLTTAGTRTMGRGTCRE